MTNPGAMFGLGDDDGSGATPAPPPPSVPSQPKESKKPAAKADTPDARPVDPLVAAQRRAVQEQQLADEVERLADLALRVLAAEPPPGPEMADAEEVKQTPQEHVIAEWRQALTSGSLSVPPGTQARASLYGTSGVQFQFWPPAGVRALELGHRLAAAAHARRWGTWQVDLHDATSCTLTREIVGEDPATPWRAVGNTAYAIWVNDPPFVRRQLWEEAGLAVKRADGELAIPKILEMVVGPRGPEILIDLPAGLSVDAAVKVTGMLARLLRAPNLAMVPEGVRIRIETRTKAADQLPQQVPLTPTSLHRPKFVEQAIQISQKIVLPLGVTAVDGRIERIEIDVAKRPHGIVVGSPGSGKSQWVRGVMTAWTVQGGLLAIGDPKGGELTSAWLPGCVHVATSKATVQRMLHWARQEMKRRLAVQGALRRKYGRTLPVQPILVVVDEFGQLMTDLEKSSDPADKAARSEIERVVANAMQVGRSVGVHLLLVAQNARVSSLPGVISDAANFRLSVGQPVEGAGGAGSIGRLFPSSMRDRADELGGMIPSGALGSMLTEHRGQPVLGRTFFGYSPGDEPEDERFTDPSHQKYVALTPEIRKSWVDMRAQLAHVPPVVRFGWKPIEGVDDDWHNLSLAAGKKGQPTLDQVLKPVPLDYRNRETGVITPLVDARPFDPLADEFDGGFDPIESDHFAPGS